MKWALVAFVGVLVLLTATLLHGEPSPEPTAKADDKDLVVFVCEHGSAKSVVAAAHFNAIAQERGLPWRAVSRGTLPDQEMAPAAVQGLQADGLPSPEGKPSLLAQEDLEKARKVVLFAIEISPELQPHQPPETWQVPPVSTDYAAARAAIVARIEELLLELERR